MSGGESTWLTEGEFDRLADYTAGVLSGRDEADVAQLVATVPRWTDAHAALVRADAAVRADLDATATPIAMPADVTARLDAALADAGTTRTSGLTATVSQARATVIPIDSRRSKRRRLGWQVAGAAAAVVAVVGGIAALNGTTVRSTTTSSAPDVASGAGANPAVPREGSGAPSVISSGRDYQPDTLGQLIRSPFAASGAPPPGLNASKGAAVSDQAVPGPNGLTRLSDPAALTACLTAIAQTRPGVVTLVDLARFEGTPAVVVLLQQGNIQTVVVVGVDCGVSGSDEKDAAVIG